MNLNVDHHSLTAVENLEMEEQLLMERLTEAEVVAPTQVEGNKLKEENLIHEGTPFKMVLIMVW